MSVGVRGLRIGTGPRGNYIRAGRGGIYYQASLPPRKPRAPQPAMPQSPTQVARPFDPTLGAFQAVDAGSSLSMRDTSSQDIVNALNETRQRWRLWPLFLVATLSTVFAATQVPLPLWQTGLIAVLLISATWIVHVRDSGRTTTVLLYDLDEPVLAAYTALNTAFDKASSSSRIWHIQAQAAVLDRKYHSGASAVVDAQITSLTKTPPARIKTNIQPLAIRFGPSTLYLLPDRILFLDSRGFGAIDYNALQCDVQYGSFVLDGAAPSDAQIIEYTWRYVNKRGGPDRRFANNPQLPVIRVADVSLRTTTGLAGILKFANVAGGEALRDGLQQFANSQAGIRGSTAQKGIEQSQHDEQHSESKADSNWPFVVAIVLSVLIPAYVAFQYAANAGESAHSSTAAIPGNTPVPPENNFLQAQPKMSVPAPTSATSASTEMTAAPSDTNELIAAVKSGTVQQVKTLLQTTADINASDQQEATALHYAVRRGDLQIVRALLESHADPNAGDDHAATPLHVAALKGRATIAGYLLINKADPNAADVDGWTPLHLAALQGHHDVIKTLLTSGADVNAADNDGWTPLHAAAIKGRQEVINTLVQYGADVDAADVTGATALHFAARKGNDDAVRVLLRLGADTGVVDNQGQTASGAATAAGHPEIAATIEKSVKLQPTPN